MLALFALAMGVSYGGAVTLTPAVVAELFGTQGLGVDPGSALYRQRDRDAGRPAILRRD